MTFGARMSDQLLILTYLGIEHTHPLTTSHTAPTRAHFTLKTTQKYTLYALKKHC